MRSGTRATHARKENLPGGKEAVSMRPERTAKSSPWISRPSLSFLLFLALWAVFADMLKADFFMRVWGSIKDKWESGQGSNLRPGQ
jgi:hypothetical protein